MSPFVRTSGLVLGLLLAAFAVSVSVAWLVPFSGFFAGMLKAGIAVVAFAAIDKFVLDEVDTVREIAGGNVAMAVLLLALALLLSASIATAATVPGAPRAVPAHVDVAMGFVGTTERPAGSNRGRDVEAFQRSVRIPAGSPWCAGFVRYAMDRAGVATPTVRSGAATAYLRDARSIDASDVLRGAVRPEPGALVVWRRGSGWQGHIGIFREDDNAAVRGPAWYGRCGLTVEGNTSSGRRGSQRDGDGVWARTRCLSPGSYFRIVGFVPVTYS